MTRVVLITGPPGIGKTAVAQAVAERLQGTKARLCGDVFLLAVTPFQANEERRRFLRENIVSFTRNAIEHDYDWVILEFVILEDEFINAFVDSLEKDRCGVCVVSLLADGEAYRARLRTKTEYLGVSKQGLQACDEWMGRVRRLKLAQAIDTSTLSVEQTVERVRLLAERIAEGPD